MKAHILIVEDEAILYERLRRLLKKAHYTISSYTPSVEEAMVQIQKQIPDLVLLDIDLKSKLSGIDLGKYLKKETTIPFIYVTKYDDDHTFFEGLASGHDNFVVKTKPQLNNEELLRAVYTALSRNQNSLLNNSVTKKGVMGLTNYPENLRAAGKDHISRIPVAFSEIIFFSIRPLPDAFLQTLKKLNPDEEGLKPNYSWFLTKKNAVYLLFYSLKKLATLLPKEFARVNDGYIVNLHPSILEGRVNGSRLVAGGEVIVINGTYKEATLKKIESYYLG